MVHQEGALFPFLTVERNVAYGVRGDRHERLREARAVLERFGIAHLARAKPGDLSGGERQRVALARAVAPGPSLLLLDEPLSALDAVTRSEVAAELEARVRELELPTIMVSHDFEDVLGLADRVAVLQAGHVVQTGTPSELVEAPASAFVASLAGVNYFAGDASATDGLTEIRGPGWAAALLSTDRLSGPVGVVVYPWEISLARQPSTDSAVNHVRGEVRSLVTLGNRVRVGLGPLTAEVTAASAERLALAEGDLLVASFKATATRLVPLG